MRNSLKSILTRNIHPQGRCYRNALVVVDGLTGENGIEILLLNLRDSQNVSCHPVDHFERIVDEDIFSPPAELRVRRSYKRQQSQLNYRQFRGYFCLQIALLA